MNIQKIDNFLNTYGHLCRSSTRNRWETSCSALMTMGQEEMHLLQEQMPAIIHYGRYTCNGRLYNIHQDYDKHTGLYTIDFSCEVVPMHIPVLIQYRESVTVTVDVSHETVVQKLLGDRLRMDEK